MQEDGWPIIKRLNGYGRQISWARIFVEDRKWEWTRDMLVLYHSHYSRMSDMVLPFPETPFRMDRGMYKEKNLTMNFCLNGFLSDKGRRIIPSVELFEPVSNYTFAIQDIRTKAGCVHSMDDITYGLLLGISKEVAKEMHHKKNWWQELRIPNKISL